MDRELVWNFVKICLLGLLSVLLTIRVWQSNAVEERLLDVQGAVKESKQSLSARANAVEERLADVQGAVKESKESLTARINAVEEATKQIKVVAATGPTTTEPAATGPANAGPATPTSEVDPRTLPYWKTDDNIHVDLTNEPRPPPDAPRGGIIRYYTGSNPRTLNVHVGNEAELQERICGPVYEYIADQSKNDPDEFVIRAICLLAVAVTSRYCVATFFATLLLLSTSPLSSSKRASFFCNSVASSGS
jgi:hypothetical protein